MVYSIFNSFITIFGFCIWSLLDPVVSASPEVLACLRQERIHAEEPHLREVRVERDKPAYLHCRLPENTNYMVAWSRSRDSALLTAGLDTFTSDTRFQASKRSNTDYVLIIRRAETRDTGCYLCEVNTEPLSTIIPVYLNVTEPDVADVAPVNKKPGKLLANMHGGEVVLNCTFSLDETSNEEQEVMWRKNDREINLNDKQKYIWKVKRDAGVLVHEIVIRSATDADDGEYACIKGRQKATQIVHVNLKAEAQVAASAPLCVSSLFMWYALFIASIL